MRWWLCLLVLLCNPAAAQEGAEQPVVDKEKLEDPVLTNEDVPEDTRRIYKTYDKQGNVIFTDAPEDKGRAREVEIREPNTFQATKVRPRPSASPEEEAAGSYQVGIVSPDNEQTFQNPSEPITVKVQVEPALKEGAQVQVTANGIPLTGSLATGFVLAQPERGEHRLEAQVIAGDQVLATSSPVVIYVHRSSALAPPEQSEPRGYSRPNRY